MEIRTRFAPSPTGNLHIGGARTALFNYLFAKSLSGKFLLRIEDTDSKRSNHSLSQNILSDLRWLKLNWDEEIVYQSHNHKVHNKTIDLLIKKGMAFRCFSSDETSTNDTKKVVENAFRSPDRDRALEHSETKPYVIRFKVPKEPSNIHFNDKIRGKLLWRSDSIEDFVIARSDGSATYNLAVVVDDHNMNISHVIRGEDHLTNTVKQLLIYKSLQWTPPIFAHIPLIHNSEGSKLSKRDGKSNMLDFKEEGFLPEAMLNYIARLGWSYQNEEFFNIDQAISWFSLESIGKSPAKFDIKKLSNISKKHMASIQINYLHESFLNYAKNYRYVSLSENQADALKLFLPLVVDRCCSHKELFEASSFLFENEEIRKQKSLSMLDPTSKKILNNFINFIHSENISWTVDGIEKFLNIFCVQNSLKFRDIGIPLRIALTGSTSSPSIIHIMQILGKQETSDRLNFINN